MKKSIRLGLLLASFIFIAWVIYMADTNHPNILFEIVRVVPYGDKIGHILLFGIMTLVSNIALNFKQIKLKGRLLLLGTIIISGLVLLEEISQHFIVYRTFDIVDLMADSVGIFTFNYLSFLLSKKLKTE